MLGLTEGEWVHPSGRRRSVGTLSRHGRAADPADRHAARQPLPRHAPGQERPPGARGRHLQHLECGTARGRHRGPSQRRGARSQIAADGRRAGQPSRGRRHRASESRSLHQSGIYPHVWLHRRGGWRRQPARTDCAGDAAERECRAAARPSTIAAAPPWKRCA